MKSNIKDDQNVIKTQRRNMKYYAKKNFIIDSERGRKVRESKIDQAPGRTKQIREKHSTYKK